MDFRPVTKPGSFSVLPNLSDYASARSSFDWDQSAKYLDGMSDGMINIAHEAIDRHGRGALADHLALRWIGRRGEVVDFTYRDLMIETSRFASGLRALGVGTGYRVFVLAIRVPELYIAALGTLNNGSVFAPLFSAFGP